MKPTNDPAEQQMRLIRRIRQRALGGLPLKMNDQEVRLLWQALAAFMTRVDSHLRKRWWQLWRKRG